MALVTPGASGSGSSASSLLAVFKQSAGTSQSIASTTQTDVDATNAAITFTAPASGNVLVRATLEGAQDAVAVNAFLGLREATTNIFGPSFAMQGTVAASRDTLISIAFYLTGVTAGAHTYKLAFSVAAGGTFTVRQIASAATIYPITLEVWSAP